MKPPEQSTPQLHRVERYKRAADRVFAADDAMFFRILNTEGDERKRAIAEVLSWVVKTIQRGDA